MRLFNDLKILYHLVFASKKGATHAERLDAFYEGQAEGYDAFRERLLQGRRELFRALPVRDGDRWVDMGGGTGANLEFLGDERLARLGKVTVVDLCGPLLEVARRRADERGWTNVETVQADVTAWTPPEGAADIVTFSYSLTMIPDWFAAVDQARAILRPGGAIGVVDFFVARKHPEAGLARHSWFTRTFWPAWFAADNVFPSPDHAPYLRRRFETRHYSEHRARVPYMMGLKTPYYLYIGTRVEDQV